MKFKLNCFKLAKFIGFSSVTHANRKIKQKFFPVKELNFLSNSKTQNGYLNLCAKDQA